MILDILYLGLAGYAFYRGYKAGVLPILMTIVGILIALLFSMRWANESTEILQRLFNSESPSFFLVGFGSIFILVIACFKLLGHLINKMLSKVHLHYINHIAGGLIFAIAVTITVSAIYGLLDRVELIPESAKSASMTWSVMEVVPEQTRAAWNGLKPIMAGFWQDTIEVIEETHEREAEQQKGKR